MASTNSLLCIGLDPHESELVNTEGKSDSEKCDAAFTFCKNLVDATVQVAACYKPNAAFFEALGAGGHETLRRVCRDVIPAEIPVLLDVKRGDIGSTAEAYADAWLAGEDPDAAAWPADALTVNPYLGPDTLEPVILSLYEFAKSITPARFFAALSEVNVARRKLARFYADHDVWLSPTTARVAEPWGKYHLSKAGVDSSNLVEKLFKEPCQFTVPHNIMGTPGLS